MPPQRGDLCAEPGVKDVHQVGEEKGEGGHHARAWVVGKCPMDSCGWSKEKRSSEGGPGRPELLLCSCRRLGCVSVLNRAELSIWQTADL